MWVNLNVCSLKLKFFLSWDLSLSVFQHLDVELSLGGQRESYHKWLKSSFVCHYVHYVTTHPPFFFFLSPLPASELGQRLSQWKRLDPLLFLLHSHSLCLSASLIGHIQNQQAEKQSVTSHHSSQHPLGLTHAQQTCVPCECAFFTLSFPFNLCDLLVNPKLSIYHWFEQWLSIAESARLPPLSSTPSDLPLSSPLLEVLKRSAS